MRSVMQYRLLHWVKLSVENNCYKKTYKQLSFDLGLMKESMKQYQ